MSNRHRVARPAGARLIDAFVAIAVIVGVIGLAGCSSSTNKTSPTTVAPGPTVLPGPGTGVLTTVGSGKFTGGKGVAAGLYDVTPGVGESGQFVVQGSSGPGDDETLGGAKGVPKIRAVITTGDSIQVSGLTKVTFTPVAAHPPVTAHTQVTLYAGIWTVGQDLGAGRYVATPAPGQSGSLVVADQGINETLGGTDGVTEYTFDANNGDLIQIGGLSQVVLAPE
jgi:hypothetical protein